MNPCRLDDCTSFRQYTLADLNNADKSAPLSQCRVCSAFEGFRLYCPTDPKPTYLDIESNAPLGSLAAQGISKAVPVTVPGREA